MIAIVAVALIIAVAAVTVVALVCIGARHEPRRSLPVQAPGPLTGLARRVLGLHIRRPCPAQGNSDADSAAITGVRHMQISR